MMKLPFKTFYWNENEWMICALSGGKCVKNANFFQIYFHFLKKFKYFSYVEWFEILI